MPVDHLFSKYYYSAPGFVNGTQQFHDVIADHIPRGASIIEVGSGPSNRTTRYLSSIGRVVGVDITDELRSNEWLHEAHVYDGNVIPLQDESFDSCVSDFVLEHVTNPETHLREVHRILRPGGAFCFRTPNLWHYVTIGSWLIPQRAHALLSNRLRGLSAANGVYPTSYRANTRRRIEKLARRIGFRVGLLRHIEAEPSYGRAGSAFFYPMMAYERLVNSSRHLSGFRSNLLGVLVKPG
jgi:SAM-dependent methyltransferase